MAKYYFTSESRERFAEWIWRLENATEKLRAVEQKLTQNELNALLVAKVSNFDKGLAMLEAFVAEADTSIDEEISEHKFGKFKAGTRGQERKAAKESLNGAARNKEDKPKRSRSKS